METDGILAQDQAGSRGFGPDSPWKHVHDNYLCRTHRHRH